MATPALLNELSILDLIASDAAYKTFSDGIGMLANDRTEMAMANVCGQGLKWHSRLHVNQ